MFRLDELRNLAVLEPMRYYKSLRDCTQLYNRRMDDS